jgi:hypothetical protein
VSKLYHYTLETNRRLDRNGSGRTIYRYHIWAPDGREIVVGRWRSSRQYAQDRAERTARILNAPP